MSNTSHKPLLLALNSAPVVLFVIVLAVFGSLSGKFLAPVNLLNILVQSSSTAIVAIGMTFVLLTAGVDLSVGAIMYVAAAVGGKLLLGGTPLGLVLAVMIAMGLICGLLNAWLITRLGIIAFIATLGTQYLERGFGLWLTETRAMNLPDRYTHLSSLRLPLMPEIWAQALRDWAAALPAPLQDVAQIVAAGLPLPIFLFGVLLLVAHVTLTRTPFGRQVYAVGQDLPAARKAGINTRRILASVYLIAGGCAAVGGILSLAQVGSVAPTFGTNKEFSAIAAAVLGGTSLFGGRGQVFPGTVLGAVLIQSVENGLVIVDANPYLYPLITSAIIFLAVLTDSVRNLVLARFNRRTIRVEPASTSA